MYRRRLFFYCFPFVFYCLSLFFYFVHFAFLLLSLGFIDCFVDGFGMALSLFCRCVWHVFHGFVDGVSLMFSLLCLWFGSVVMVSSCFHCC